MATTLVPPRRQTSWLPDPTFYPSPRMAAQAPPETLAYVALVSPDPAGADALGVVDCDPASTTYGEMTYRLDMPHAGDELHHYGWNACSASLCPYAPHPHIRRRYLVLPGLRSSRIYIVDTEPDPGRPHIVRTIEPDALAAKTGYSRPHTVHCGPDGIYVSAIGNADGDAPGGILVLDHDTFEPLGAWEIDRGPQRLAYDFWWHLGWDVMLTSEWGTPNTVEAGLQPDVLMDKGYGRDLHVWDLRKRRHVRALRLGDDAQFVLELRPAHHPGRRYGFAGVVLNLSDLSSSIWLWHFRDGDWQAQEVIRIPATPAATELLPPALQPFGAVPPLVTDINLSLDDRFLYVSCWGSGVLRQYDVRDPFHPVFTGEVELGGIVGRAAHPSGRALSGGPQMVELSRDGRRVYVTNSLYRAWDDQFYPEGMRGWMACLDAGPDGGLSQSAFLIDFGEHRAHQVRLGGGDASSDSFCFG
ncbi:MAG TPA: selenium-binding protein SBP56-related protein [Longimicrobiales bacterium]